jgi:hypothetical protein
MTNQHPITPPPELFQMWEDDILNERDNVDHVLDCAWKDGFLAGADQELEACVEWLFKYQYDGEVPLLRAARRPKPPSLKEQALAILDDANRGDLGDDEMATIRRALEALPE